MLQVETQGVPPRLQSRSVTSWVPKPLLLLQIKMNDEPSVKYLNLQQLGARNPSICYRSRQRKTSNLNISICNNNLVNTGLIVTDLDIRNRLIGSSESVTSGPQNGPQMLQIETEESLPDFKSQSVTHRTDYSLLLLQIKTNGGSVWQPSQSVTSGAQFFCLLFQNETNL